MSYAGQEFDIAARNLLCPEDYVNPTPQGGYHLVILGAGPAGLIAAIGAAGLGAKVALVEKHLMGGDCLNVGCVPSKAILTYAEEHDAPQFEEALRFARKIRADIAPHDSVERYSEQGVDVYLGAGEFIDEQSVRVGEQVLTGRRFLISTGARAAIPPIPGLSDSNPLTNETLFDLTEQPATLGILGAGVIGCEMAQAFSKLGTEVHLFELADEVLPLEDREAAQVMRSALEQAGIHLHTGFGVQSIAEEAGQSVVTTEEGSYPVDRILVALGRRPNTDSLGLDKAGVSVDQQGFIETDEKLRSNNKKIYAAGDCTSRKQFTHNADAQARVVVQNALFAPTAAVTSHVVPRCIYTQPELAAVGLGERELREQGLEFDTFKFELGELDRGRVQQDQISFAKVFTKKGTDKLLGATVIGKDAGEQIAPLTILMANELGLSALGKTIFPYPTRSEYLKRLADAYNRTRMTPTVANLFKKWLSFTKPGH